MSMHQIIRNKGLLAALSGLVLLVIVLYSLGIIGGPEKTEPGRVAAQLSPVPAGASTFTIGKVLSDNVMLWPGTLRSRSVVKIAPKLQARILEVLVHAGDNVNKGDVIARLDKQALQAAYQAANAALSAVQARAQQANADEQRIQALYAKEAATRQNLDAVTAQAKAARAAVRQAQGALRQIQVNLNENSLVAPFTGIISERLKEPGDMGLPNDPIVILQKSDDLRAEASIPSNCAKRVALGQPVEIRVETLDLGLTGKVDEIVPEIDPSTRTQLIKVSLPSSQGLVPGLFVWLEQSCENQLETLLIPQSAVQHYGQLEAVKIVMDKQVYTRHIRIGKLIGDQVEVLSGLREGETILLENGHHHE